jgi:hypothetical protein
MESDSGKIEMRLEAQGRGCVQVRASVRAATFSWLCFGYFLDEQKN